MSLLASDGVVCLTVCGSLLIILASKRSLVVQFDDVPSVEFGAKEILPAIADLRHSAQPLEHCRFSREYLKN